MRNAVMRLRGCSQRQPGETSCFCSGSAPRGSPRALHPDHSVNGAIIHTQLTAAACDGQPVALGGSSLGAKMGLVRCVWVPNEGRRTHETPHLMHRTAARANGPPWSRRDLREMLERAAECASFGGPHHPRQCATRCQARGNLLSIRYRSLRPAATATTASTAGVAFAVLLVAARDSGAFTSGRRQSVDGSVVACRNA